MKVKTAPIGSSIARFPNCCTIYRESLERCKNCGCVGVIDSYLSLGVSGEALRVHDGRIRGIACACSFAARRCWNAVADAWAQS